MTKSNKAHTKSYAEINEKIKSGDALVLTAEEMISFVEENGVSVAAKEVDVVTTGTFGAMCSSGALLNFGHSDPPIKMQKVWLNDVEAYTGIAAVDAYLGATQLSETEGISYGGGHVIEDLLKGEEIELRATSNGTDCYPRKKVKTDFTLNDLNQAWLLNPRNAYQNYAAATNSSETPIYTYMGKLLPDNGNVTYTTSSQLSPLINDPYFETIGFGTRIFLGGGEGFVIGEGTQFNTEVPRKNGVPVGPAGTIAVKGDLKGCSPKYIRGGSFTGYGVSLYVGLGIPIPILNEDIAKRCAIKDEEIFTNVLDYSAPGKPILKEVNYKELRSGKIELGNKEVRTSSLASLDLAREIADELKTWVEKDAFSIAEPISYFPKKSIVRPMRQNGPEVSSIMKRAITIKETGTITEVSKLMIGKGINHILIERGDKLWGIVTSWDLARALAEGKEKLEEVATRKVITTSPKETTIIAAEKMRRNNISALPVIGAKGEILGIITNGDLASALRK